ncbi:MAG: guanylate kinase [Actinobacteria bacterium]|nr:guanylate kinase [Actinomycetota bacterium]
MFVISGPSGVGKGTVVRRLLERDPSLFFSVSAKTRAPRPGEVDGRDYWFISEEEFDRLIAEDAFLEWAGMFGHRSGTLIEPVERTLDAGTDVILEIDVQGARLIRERVPDAYLIFLAPPSADELVRRLRRRASEGEREVRHRLAVAEEEMRRAPGFDRIVVNDDVERATDEVASIIEGHRSAR